MEYRSKKGTLALQEDFLPSRNEFYHECGISTSGKVQSKSKNSNFNIFQLERPQIPIKELLQRSARTRERKLY